EDVKRARDIAVERNMTLGTERPAGGVIRRSAHRQRVCDALARLERPDIRPGTPVQWLSPAQRQLVEIARALMADARILVMDEPSSSLGLADIEHLFRVISGLRERGVAVIYISHFLEEIQRVADRYTVLRDGLTGGKGGARGAALDALVQLMIGRKIDQMFPRVPHEIGEPILQLDSLSARPLPVQASLTLHSGEILG